MVGMGVRGVSQYVATGVCPVCTLPVPPWKGTGRRPIYCSKGCSRKATRPDDRQAYLDANPRRCTEDDCNRAHVAHGLCGYHYRKAIPDHLRTKQVEQTCAWCGEKFMRALRKQYTNAFCDMQCRDMHTSEHSRKPRLLVGPVPRMVCFVPVQHPSRRPLPRKVTRVWVAGCCTWCGESFLHNQPAAKYCSVKCMKRSNKRGDVSLKIRREVYARDANVCQLCYGDVDITLPWTDAWSASLDHVCCVSWNGRDDNVDNLRLAHRWCNQVRSDESRWIFKDGDLVRKAGW